MLGFNGKVGAIVWSQKSGWMTLIKSIVWKITGELLALIMLKTMFREWDDETVCIRNRVSLSQAFYSAS